MWRVDGKVDRTLEVLLLGQIMQNESFAFFTHILRRFAYRLQWDSYAWQTDLWKGYRWIEDDIDYRHQTVNHSVEFKNSQTGVHTNVVEGTSSAIKRRLSVRSRVRLGIEGHLDEFIWRRKHEAEDLWECFISALREIHYDLE